MPALAISLVGDRLPAPRGLEFPVSRVAEELSEAMSLVKRVAFNVTNSNDTALVAAVQRQDPWSKSGKYALGWVYFCLIILLISMILRFYHLWTDKIRCALYKEEASLSYTPSPDSQFEMKSLDTSNTGSQLFPQHQIRPKEQSSVSSVGPLNNAIALSRFVFYRPPPVMKWKRHHLVPPSLGVIVIVLCALVFVTLYCFLPQPLYYVSIRLGSPPLAIRAGMLAVAMVPWIVAMSMKANIVSTLTGIGHERLNVLHRWGGYLCLFLSLVHTVPFYIQPAKNIATQQAIQVYFGGTGLIYGTGIAALVPLAWLCIASLPVIRTWMYELFVALHVPVAMIYVGMLFWHCSNYLTSWNYLWATLAIWGTSYIARLLKLNWANPRRMSWLIGEEAAITILPENAIKITIPTQVRWRPGQYVYLRLPGISVFENHPFTIASLCSDDFPSEYGDAYRDMTLVFRPFGGFTKKVLDTAIAKGPYKTYRAFLDGPYGGMQRRLEAFDTVVLVAGGSGITAIVSQLLELVKRMRDGKAVTKRVEIIWAIKRPESMEWFKEELRICRDYAPPDSVHCQFFITTAKRYSAGLAEKGHRPISGFFGSDKINEIAQGIASKRNSALIREEAAGDVEKERELRRENEDGISALPPAYLGPPTSLTRKNKPSLDLSHLHDPTAKREQGNFDFGFPTTPSVFRKNLMRFAFGVGAVKKKDGWSTEYGRPDIAYMLRQSAQDFGKRTCVFVCGPPSMRTVVASTVAQLQHDVWDDPQKDEIFLHTENYAI